MNSVQTGFFSEILPSRPLKIQNLLFRAAIYLEKKERRRNKPVADINILEEIERGRQTLEHLKDTLKTAINDLPDNPRIERLNGNGKGSLRAFVIKSSDTGGIISPFFHDFKAQYRKIAEILDKARIETINSVLVRILETGSYSEKGGTVKFHPEVIRNLAGFVCGGSNSPADNNANPGPGAGM